MRITIAAVGRLKGPERELVERYADRADKAGRQLALRVSVREIPESRAGTAIARKQQEAEALVAALPAGARLVALDETGKSLDSTAFADEIAAWRDGGTADLVLAIGGPDGHGDALLAGAAFRLSFGRMTWPHQIARLMAAEQVYRAVTILAGHPYHRG
jgi:23S rRNA (pseudouridine1915-N3)-methyltransferase